MYVIKGIHCEEYLHPSASGRQWEEDPENATQYASIGEAVTAVVQAALMRGDDFGDLTICKLVPKRSYIAEEVK